jgi:pimeloyl-ACP methyl ester carboxylesterase
MAMVNDQSAFPEWDTDAYLRAIECPVVLEHGDRDWDESQGMASAIYEGELERATPLVKDLRVLHIPGTGHLPWATSEAARFYAELASFIALHTGT